MRAIPHAELKEFRERLLAMQSRLSGTVGELGDEALSPSARLGGGQTAEAAGDSGDLSVQDDAHDIALGLLQNERQLLSQVNAALQRLDDGTFGRCSECGRPISLERLRALPYTPYCLEDADRLEKEFGGLPPPNGVA